ncbi:MAG: ROK family protein [Candidatus Aenigmarchaeota archaeon]|nr:ROK family protein [Candidatus Aenigmarchaeota archaeon]
MAYFAGIDVGGSHVEGVLTASDMQVSKRIRIGISKRSRKSFLKAIKEILDGFAESGLKGVGFGVPGPVRKGVMFWSCNSTFLENIDFMKIGKRYSSRVVVDNDVNAMAFGEALSGSIKNLLAVTLGTGVGGGIVIEGSVYSSRPFAGEVGHMSIDTEGVKCTCGSRGCWQEYAGSRGVKRLSKKHLGRAYEPERLYLMAEDGDRKALNLWKDYGRLVGAGLANLSNILDPEAIVLGGGISAAFEFFEKSMKDEMKKRLRMKPPKVIRAREDAVAFGAACMAMKA